MCLGVVASIHFVQMLHLLLQLVLPTMVAAGGLGHCPAGSPCQCPWVYINGRLGYQVLCAQSNLDTIQHFENKQSVFSLSMPNNKLINTTELAGFRNLIILDVNFNEIQVVPSKWKYLVSLQFVTADWNLICSVEPGALKPLRHLHYLSLEGNKLAGIPTEIRYLSELGILNLASNLICEIDPSAFENLKKLKILNLKNNSITEVPVAVRSLTSLYSLNLSQNKIRVLSVAILRTLKELRVLDISENLISDIPQQITSLIQKTPVDASRNKRTSLAYCIMSALSRGTKGLYLYLGPGDHANCGCALRVLGHMTLKQAREHVGICEKIPPRNIWIFTSVDCIESTDGCSEESGTGVKKDTSKLAILVGGSLLTMLTIVGAICFYYLCYKRKAHAPQTEGAVGGSREQPRGLQNTRGRHRAKVESNVYTLEPVP